MQIDPLSIPGLRYLPGYIDDQQQRELVAAVDRQPWLADLRRRVQHYGYRYNYMSRSVDASMRLGPLPEWSVPLARRLHAEGLIPAEPDQLIVNEYLPGQGISSHIDCVPCFGDTIISLSLGSPCVMLFSRSGPAVEAPLLLEPGSLTVMQGAARYAWKHSIPARKVDSYQERLIERGRRVSLTFRSVILERAA